MNSPCPHCFTVPNSVCSTTGRKLIVSAGHFFRQEDHSFQKRFKCRNCKKSFSNATHEIEYRHKKRVLNSHLLQLLVSGVSLRRAAKILLLNRKTVVRKFVHFGVLSELSLKQMLLSSDQPLIEKVQFDDLETFEHTKLKPLSVIMAVEEKTRRILGFRVARMPAKGLLVKKSLAKYGPRKDERSLKRKELFGELKRVLHPRARLKSDQSTHYERDVKKYFPDCEHITFKSRKACVTGQGEIKAGGFDPLFSINHSFAMLRANINRLFRRTWNTTKKPERLSYHIALYINFHNQELIA